MNKTCIALFVACIACVAAALATATRIQDQEAPLAPGRDFNDHTGFHNVSDGEHAHSPAARILIGAVVVAGCAALVALLLHRGQQPQAPPQAEHAPLVA